MCGDADPKDVQKQRKACYAMFRLAGRQAISRPECGQMKNVVGIRNDGWAFPAVRKIVRQKTRVARIVEQNCRF